MNLGPIVVQQILEKLVRQHGEPLLEEGYEDNNLASIQDRNLSLTASLHVTCSCGHI